MGGRIKFEKLPATNPEKKKFTKAKVRVCPKRVNNTS
jgi:hypothetical protein